MVWMILLMLGCATVAWVVAGARAVVEIYREALAEHRRAQFVCYPGGRQQNLEVGEGV